MRTGIRFFFITLIGLLSCVGTAESQIKKPVKWSFTAVEVEKNTFDLVFKAKIDKKWHVYANDLGCKPDQVCPIQTSINVPKSIYYEKIGKIKEEGKLIEEYDPNFELKLKYYEDEVKFIQRIKLKKSVSKLSTGYEFMTCDDKQCLAPDSLEAVFNIPKGGFKSDNSTADPTETGSTEGWKVTTPNDSDSVSSAVATTQTEETKKKDEVTSVAQSPEDAKKARDKAKEEEDKGNLWKIFLGGFLGGFLALLTPCVFPIIPMTVSFFTKKTSSRQKAIRNALIFGLSIIFIYVLIGFSVTRIFGSDALSELSTNAFFNLLFFVVFIVFAISFFGVFEINLPSSWVNASDKNAERGGLVGIFFMAFTLALVSFSCTGPIIGQLLVIAAIGGGVLGPLTGMFGFSLALALPFTLFAIFPNWLSNLPRSGGWLNSVKVVLGFIELALALKFLSAVDLAYHWDFLKREYFLAIWIIIFILCGFYLLGKLKFSHDTDLPHIPIPRLLFAIVSFSFALYMIPGLWGAPVNLLSGLAPPSSYNEGIWEVLTPKQVSTSSNVKPRKKHKYDHLFHAPHGMDLYFDYDEALTAAKSENKPLMLDFTGHACVNCRKMENTVWPRPEILQRLNENFIIVSLYVDDKTSLPENEQFTSTQGKKIKTLGNKWSDLEAVKYGQNTQPLYVIIDHNENVLSGKASYDPDASIFIKFLDDGKAQFEKSKK